MQISSATDTGKKREINEDSLFVDKDLGLFIVADGMGGHQAGEVASGTAVKIIASFIKENIGKGEPASIIKEAIFKANNEIVINSIEEPNLEGMGTTVVLALQNGGKIYIANVGDSRAYLINDSRIEQLTDDHTLIAELVSAGKMTKEEARVHPKRNILTNAMGASLRADACIRPVIAEKGDCILLCTDGLTDMLTDDEIKGIVISPNLSTDEKCRELISRANEEGGRDNITVVLIVKDKEE